MPQGPVEQQQAALALAEAWLPEWSGELLAKCGAGRCWLAQLVNQGYPGAALRLVGGSQAAEPL